MTGSTWVGAATSGGDALAEARKRSISFDAAQLKRIEGHRMKTSESLSVIWPDPGGGSAELSGISFYGFLGDAPAPFDVALLANRWSTQAYETRTYEASREIL